MFQYSRSLKSNHRQRDLLMMVETWLVTKRNYMSKSRPPRLNAGDLKIDSCLAIIPCHLILNLHFNTPPSQQMQLENMYNSRLTESVLTNCFIHGGKTLVFSGYGSYGSVLPWNKHLTWNKCDKLLLNAGFMSFNFYSICNSPIFRRIGVHRIVILSIFSHLVLMQYHIWN